MDLEKQTNDNGKGAYSVEVGSGTTESEPQPPPSKGFLRDTLDGFKRADLSGIDTSQMTELEIQAYLTSKAPLKRELKAWQISLIAIGGSVGAGLFLGSGNSFNTGGPAGVVIGFGVIGVMIFCTMQSLGELAVRFPVSGAYLQHVSRFVDPCWSLAMGWNYLISQLITFPLELISASITLGFWNEDDNGATNVSKAAWVSLFYAVCLIINLFGVKGYGYGESFLSIIKIIAILGFFIFAIVVICGGYPGSFGPDIPGYTHGLTGKYIGGHFYHEPGAFANGAKGVFTVLVNAAFAFAGTEVSGLAAAESANPGRDVPRACKQVFWRVLLFYVISLSLVGCLVPYDDDRLGSAGDGRASPFVIAISNANVRALPSIFNIVICLSVLSVGNYCIYAGSRTIASLAAQGFAPRIFAYIDREGRPLMGTLLLAVFGLLCFLAASDKHNLVFDWLMALSGLSSIFIWGSINLAHIRFRMGMHSQGRSLNDELIYKSPVGIIGSLLGFGINIAIVGLQFWVALFPPGEDPDPEVFFKAYLSIPVVIACYIGARIYMYAKGRKMGLFVRASDMDLDSGMDTHDLVALKEHIEAERARVKSRGIMYRIYHFWC